MFKFHNIAAEDLSNRLMARVDNFSYQDEKVLEKIKVKARFCEAIFSDNDKAVCLLGAILLTPESVACQVLESLGYRQAKQKVNSFQYRDSRYRTNQPS